MRRWRWIALFLLVLGIAWLVLSPRGPAVERGSFLRVDLRGAFVDAPVSPLARLLGRREASLVSLLSELTKAERDERIAGVLFRIGGLDMGWGKAEELRAALARLRDKGKRSIAYLELEQLGGNLEYYLASGADEVVMAPASRNALVGLAGEYLFLGGLFEKVGVELEYERIGEYKSAVESYAERAMSDANREMTEALLDSIDGRFVSAIAASRELAPERVRAAIDEAPTTPERMRELGLVDRVAWGDEVLAEETPVVEADAYAGVDPAAVGFAPVATFALVYGAGPVVTGEGFVSPRGGFVLAADTVADAIDQAAEAPDVRAIVFRVDSPGGSPLASDIVWRAIQRARQRGKPVVASFSDVAASGGYYVACGADRIVSQPTTFTGSIGVFVLRPVLRDLLDDLDVGVATITRGARAELLLSSQPLSPESREVLRTDVRSIYDLFVRRVAEGRSLGAEEVDAVGRGRVWTGAQAEERGLVDALGGLREAVRQAKELTGIDLEADVVLVQYPPPKPLPDQIAEALGLAVRAAVPRLPLPRAAAALFDTLVGLPPGAPALVPPVWPEVR
jgi:protease-4